MSRCRGCSACRGPSAVGLVEAGAVLVDGKAPVKSDRVSIGSWLEVTLPGADQVRRRSHRTGARSADRVRRRRPRGRRQAGRGRRPPEPGLVRADRHRRAGCRGLPARRPPERPSGRASCTALTSARPGLMVVAKSERAYTSLKDAFRERTVDKRYTALVQGHPDPSRRHDRRADRPAPDPRLQVGGGRGRAARA